MTLPMTPDEDRIAQLYDAYNGRAFDRCVALMAQDVAWPDEVEDGEVRGRQGVLDYFTRVTAPLRAHYDLISLHTDADGRISVLSRQAIASAADGSLWSSTRVVHRFTLRDGLITRMESEQDWQGETFPGIDALVRRVHDAINARDLEAIVACYAPTAAFVDSFEDTEIQGLDGVRAHFEHLLDTIRLNIVVMDSRLQADDRVRVRLQVETRGPGGGLWQDGLIVVWYRLERGLIAEQDVDDSGRDGNEP